MSEKLILISAAEYELLLKSVSEKQSGKLQIPPDNTPQEEESEKLRTSPEGGVYLPASHAHEEESSAKPIHFLQAPPRELCDPAPARARIVRSVTASEETQTVPAKKSKGNPAQGPHFLEEVEGWEPWV